ncbi:MAG: hypothetical protein RMY63_26855, partial [Nostoc sp. ChiQUE01b]|nr:hypothetical protein [Nostoc sp. ChiQUE01b]
TRLNFFKYICTIFRCVRPDQWAALAPDECQTTYHSFKFQVRILTTVEKCESTDAWRLITTENFEPTIIAY